MQQSFIFHSSCTMAVATRVRLRTENRHLEAISVRPSYSVYMRLLLNAFVNVAMLYGSVSERRSFIFI